MTLKPMRNRRRQKNVKFKPTRDFLHRAIEFYLNNGGRITRLESVNDHPNYFDDIGNGDVDAFLSGN